MSRVGPQLDLALLRFVRDARPTEAELLAWLGRAPSRYHDLRKAGLLRVIEDRVVLSPDHLSADGARFRFENRLFLLDEDQELIF